MMRSTLTTVCLLAMAGFLSTSALAQNSQSDQQTGSASESSGSSQSSAEQQQGQSQTPEGWVLVEERAVVLTANEPQNHFLRAHQLLKQNDDRAAAAEVRIGATYLDMQKARSGGQADQQLKQASKQLRQLASTLSPQAQQQEGQQQEGQQQQGQQQQRQASSPQEQLQQMNQTFAQANKALAQHFQSLAKTEVQKNKAIMSGYDLNAAANSLAAAYTWSGKQPSQQVASALQQAKQIANRLATSEGSSQFMEQSGQAQTAGARIGGQQQSQSEQSKSKIPDNASQVIDQLGSAIQQSSFQEQSSFQRSSNMGQKSQSQQSQEEQNETPQQEKREQQQGQQ